MHDALCAFCSYSLVIRCHHFQCCESWKGSVSGWCPWCYVPLELKSKTNSLSSLRFRCLYDSSQCQETGGICLPLLTFRVVQILYFNPCQFKFEVLRQGRRLDSRWKNGCKCTDKGIVQTLLPQGTWQIMPNRSFLLLSTTYTMDFKDALQLSEITLLTLY